MADHLSRDDLTLIGEIIEEMLDSLYAGEAPYYQELIERIDKEIEVTPIPFVEIWMGQEGNDG